MNQNERTYLDAMVRGDALAGMAAAAAMGVFPETRYRARCFRRDGSLRWEAEAKNRVVTVGLNKLLDAAFVSGLTTPLWYVGLVNSSITDGVTNGTTAFTSASNPWQIGDVGRNIILRGAGASGADLVTTIATFVNSGSITLGSAAGATLTGVTAVWEARAADTMASHAPWSGQTNYSNATRPAWTPGAVANGSVDNSGSPASFSINADNVLIGGFFLVNDNTKAGTTGTLYGMAVWTSGGFRQAYSGDTMQVTATLSAAST